MTDRDEPAFDDPGHAELRRLLADARIDTPMPDEVAGRLDDALAALHRQHRGSTAPVAPPHRRVAPRLLAAAAALVVVGGVGTLVAQQAGPWSGGGTAATSDTATGATSRSGAPMTQRQDAEGPVLAAGGLPEVRPDHLSVDAARVLAQPGYRARLPGASTSAGAAPGSPEAAPLSELLTCPGPSAARGPSIVVRFGATPAALVLRPAVEGRRTVEVWSCSGDTRLADAVLPAGVPADD